MRCQHDSEVNMDLSISKCVPCRVGAPILTQEEIKNYLGQVDENWQHQRSPDKIIKEFEFDNFNGAILFINEVAKIAEDEGHHPSLYLHDYKMVRVELWTHKIGGLHKNDFILASKIEKLG